MSAVLDFLWSLDSSGYDLTADKKTIRRKGGTMRAYPPAKEWAIHREFASMGGTPADMLAFVQKYGFLGTVHGGADAASESIASLKAQHDALGSFALLHGAEDWAQVSVSQGDIDGFNQFAAAPHMVLKLVPTRSGRPKAVPVPVSLAGWLWLATAQEITGEVTWRPCERCGKLFAVGSSAHTNKRKYCSDSCKVMSQTYYQQKRGKS